MNSVVLTPRALLLTLGVSALILAALPVVMPLPFLHPIETVVVLAVALSALPRALHIVRILSLRGVRFLRRHGFFRKPETPK